MMHQKPLAERLRPQTLKEYIGQEKLVGETGSLKKIINRGSIPSCILWGPPGVGKTTLANLISNELQVPFHSLSAINSGVKDVREVIQQASKKDMFSKAGSPLLFIDEIHRFSKSQQDSLLGAVEKGTVTLIGATTENPSFEVIPALLSRCQLYVLQPLGKTHLDQIIERAFSLDNWLKESDVELAERDLLYTISGGDARKLLNTLELVIQNLPEDNKRITNDRVKEIVADQPVSYDKQGEQHYDVISAFIKSIRGSDPNASLYWLARMIEGGEDPTFIARRLLIAASEDIGNANPTALVIATNCFQAVQMTGYPECEIILAQAVTYLASSAKSNASYLGIKKAKELVRETGGLPVPLHLRNAPTQLMRELDYGNGYQYAHDFRGGFSNQEYMPDKLSGVSLYEPKDSPREAQIKEHLKTLWGTKYDY